MAVDIGTLEALLKLRDEMSASLKNSASALQKFNQVLNEVDSTTKKTESSLSSFGKTALSFASGQWLADLGRQALQAGISAVKMAGDFEQIQIAFTTMLGSGQVARAFLDQLADFAAKTPFQFPELVESSKSLLAMGFAAKDVIPMMTSLGNAAAALGGGGELIGRMVNQLGQMQAKGKVATEELRVLAQTGLPVWEMLAQKIGVSVPEAMDRVQNGAVKASVGIQAILEGINSRFGGLMEKQSQTMLGRLSTLKDNLSFVARDFGTALLPAVGRAVDAISAMLPSLRGVGEVAGSVISAAVDIIGDLGSIVIDVGGIFVEAFGAAAEVVKLASGGLIDFGAAADNARLAGDAIRLLWLGLKSAVLDFGIALNEVLLISAKVNAIFFPLQNNKEILSSIQSNIDLLKALKEEYSDTANAIVNSSDPPKKASIDLAAELDKLKNKMKDLGDFNKESAKAAEHAAKEHAKLLEKYREQHTEAGRAAAANKQLGIVLEALGPLAKVTFKNFEEGATQLRKMGSEGEEAAKKLESAFFAAQNVAKLPAGRNIMVAVPKMDEFAQLAQQASREFGEAFTKEAAARKWFFENIPIDMPREQYRAIAKALGVELGDGIGKVAGPSFGKSFTASLRDLPSIILGAIQGGGDVGKAIGAHLGGTIGKSLEKTVSDGLSSVFGKGIGGALGSIIPGVGTALGALGGQLAGKLFGGLFGGEGKKVNDLRDQFVAAAGGIAALDAKAHSAGLTLDRLLGAKKVKDFESAVKELTGAFDLQKESNDRLDEAVKKYGFSVEELGPKWRNQRLDEMAGGLLQDYQLLIASGIDNTTVIARMGPAFQDYVNTARAAGQAIPESMRPAIEQMIKMGLLVDENGNAFSSVQEAGISFTETLSEGLARAIDGINRLVAALGGVQSPKPIHIPVQFDLPPNVREFIPEVPSGDEVSAASGYFSPSLPRDTTFRLHKGERVEVTPAEEVARRNQAVEVTPVAASRPTVVREQPVVLMVEQHVLGTVLLRMNESGRLPMKVAG